MTPAKAQRAKTMQELFERQGFLVIACAKGGHGVGDIIAHAHGAQWGAEFVTEGPMIITGPATEAEWFRQNELFEGSPGNDGTRYAEYWKVAAE
jgi:hypothetical protein